jgi:hypothetical protein
VVCPGLRQLAWPGGRWEEQRWETCYRSSIAFDHSYYWCLGLIQCRSSANEVFVIKTHIHVR